MTKLITNLKSIGQRRDRFIVDPKIIVDIDGLNERYDYGDLSTLKDQIKAHGIQVDLWVRLENGKLGLVRGYRRMRCVRELIAEKAWKHGGVPVISEPKDHTDTDRLLGQIIGNEGKPYTILEQGRVFERLITAGLSKVQIGDQTGKSRTHVSNALALAAAPPAIITFIEQNKISESLVIDLIRDVYAEEVPGPTGGVNQTFAEKLVEKVMAAIGGAEAKGKTHATRKHATPRVRKKREPATNGSGPPEPASADPAATTTATSAPAPAAALQQSAIPNPQSAMPIQTPLERLNKFLLDIDRHECEDACYDTILAVRDFLEEKTDATQLKAFIRK